MRRLIAGGVQALAVVTLAIAGMRLLGVRSTQAQAPTGSRAPAGFPRVDGHPNLSGIWQALNTADWDLQSHQAKMGPVVPLGADGAIPPGMGVVEGEEIP